MRSDNIKKGIERAPHRSLLYALGCTESDMDKPFIGIVNSFTEINPGTRAPETDCRCRQERASTRRAASLSSLIRSPSATASP